MDMKHAAVLCLGMLLIPPALVCAEVAKEYWPDGQVKWERSYQDGKLNGISKSYYKDGTLQTEANFKDGIKDGSETTYLRWDTQKTVTIFEQGKAITTRRYDQKERLRDELIFTYGEEGSWTVRQILYDEKGKVILDHEL